MTENLDSNNVNSKKVSSSSSSEDFFDLVEKESNKEDLKDDFLSEQKKVDSNSDESSNKLSNPLKEDTKIRRVFSIAEIRNSEDSGLAYQLTALVKKIYRSDQGLNIFTVSDGEDSLRLVTFVKGGIAYGAIEEGGIATFIIKRRSYDGELQGTILDAKAQQSSFESRQLKKRLLLSQYKQFVPSNEDLLLDSMSFEKLKHSMIEIATLIRGAVFTSRPLILSHHADSDGFSGGLQLELAIKDLIKKKHPRERFLQNYFIRNPSKTPYYDVSDATKDITFFQLNSERSGLANPLIIILDNGSTKQDLLAIRKVSIFGADVVVIDHHDPGLKDESGFTETCKEVLSHVNPHLFDLGKTISASMLALEIAHFVNPDIEPNYHLAVLGGVADYCSGAEVDQLLRLTNEREDSLRKLSYLIEFEISQQRFFQSSGSLIDFLLGKKQKELVDLYSPILEEEQSRVELAINEFESKEIIGDFTLFYIDSEDVSFWNDFFSPGKIAAILHQLHSDVEKRISLVFMDNIAVFRVSKSDSDSFDVNALVASLLEKFPFARISGGGHDVAGSIRFVKGSKEDIFSEIKKYISVQQSND